MIELLVFQPDDEAIVVSACLPGAVDWDQYGGYRDNPFWLITEVDDPELEARLKAHGGPTIGDPYVEEQTAED